MNCCRPLLNAALTRSEEHNYVLHIYINIYLHMYLIRQNMIPSTSIILHYSSVGCNRPLLMFPLLHY